MIVYSLAGGEGFEPPLAESESAVLPLDDPPNSLSPKNSAWSAMVLRGPHSAHHSSQQSNLRHGHGVLTFPPLRRHCAIFLRFPRDF